MDASCGIQYETFRGPFLVVKNSNFGTAPGQALVLKQPFRFCRFLNIRSCKIKRKFD